MFTTSDPRSRNPVTRDGLDLPHECSRLMQKKLVFPDIIHNDSPKTIYYDINSSLSTCPLRLCVFHCFYLTLPFFTELLLLFILLLFLFPSPYFYLSPWLAITHSLPIGRCFHRVLRCCNEYINAAQIPQNVRFFFHNALMLK